MHLNYWFLWLQSSCSRNGVLILSWLTADWYYLYAYILGFHLDLDAGWTCLIVTLDVGWIDLIIVHAHAYIAPADLLGWWRRVAYSPIAWYAIEDLIAEIRYVCSVQLSLFWFGLFFSSFPSSVLLVCARSHHGVIKKIYLVLHPSNRLLLLAKQLFFGELFYLCSVDKFRIFLAWIYSWGITNFTSFYRSVVDHRIIFFGGRMLRRGSIIDDDESNFALRSICTH